MAPFGYWTTTSVSPSQHGPLLGMMRIGVQQHLEGAMLTVPALVSDPDGGTYMRSSR